MFYCKWSTVETARVCCGRFTFDFAGWAGCQVYDGFPIEGIVATCSYLGNEGLAELTALFGEPSATTASRRDVLLARWRPDMFADLAQLGEPLVYILGHATTPASDAARYARLDQFLQLSLSCSVVEEDGSEDDE